MPAKPLKWMSNMYQGPSYITEDDPNAVEFSNAAYDRMFSEAAGYSQRDPNAPRRVLPSGPQIDPRAFINTKLKELGDRSEAQYKAILDSGLDQTTIQRMAMGIQDEYDQAKGQLTSGLGQLDLIQQGIAAGELTAEAGREAAIRMIVPRETADLMFPSMRAVTPSATGVSPAGMTSYVKRFETVREGMLEYIGGKKWYRWDTKQASRKKMIERYFNERRIAGLNDPRNANKIPGFNQAFIESMGEDDRTAELITKLLDPDTGDSRMLAAFAPDSRINRAFLDQFSVTKKRPGVSPLGQSIASALPKPTPQPPEDFTVMSEEELRRIAEGK